MEFTNKPLAIKVMALLHALGGKEGRVVDWQLEAYTFSPPQAFLETAHELEKAGFVKILSENNQLYLKLLAEPSFFKDCPELVALIKLYVTRLCPRWGRLMQEYLIIRIIKELSNCGNSRPSLLSIKETVLSNGEFEELEFYYCMWKLNKVGTIKILDGFIYPSIP